MKTCPNPKCNMYGIPDDATFCPKCGAKIVRRKKDTQQLLNEALSAWDKYPNKPKNKNLKENFKVLNHLAIYSAAVIWGFFTVISMLIKNLGSSDGALNVFLLLEVTIGGLWLLSLTIVAISGYIQDKKELKEAKNAFIKKYIQANEYE